MCKSSYPLEIIPHNGYKVNGFAIDEILEAYPKIEISRRVDGNVEDYIDFDEGRPHLDIDCFGSNFVHMSVNLMNSRFRNEHIKYYAHKEASKQWDGQPISIKEYFAHIGSLDDSTAIFYNVGSLHRHPFNVKQSLKKGPYNSMRDFLGDMAMASFSGKNEKQDADFAGNIEIEHTPVNLNYWHCQIEIYPKENVSKSPIDETETSKKKKLQNSNSWREEIFIHVLSNILAYDFSITSKSQYEIDPKFYLSSCQ